MGRQLDTDAAGKGIRLALSGRWLLLLLLLRGRFRRGGVWIDEIRGFVEAISDGL